MTFVRAVGLALIGAAAVGCETTSDASLRNPIYDASGNVGTNPMFESTHLAIDNEGRPLLVYAHRVLEPTPTALKDTLKTQVRVVRPDEVAENAAQPLLNDAMPRAVGTVKGVTQLWAEGADGAVRALALGGAEVTLTGFSAARPVSSHHQSVVNVDGVAFGVLRSDTGETAGQTALVELSPVGDAPRVMPVGKALGDATVPFLAAGREGLTEFVVGFSTADGAVKTALSTQGVPGAPIDAGLSGALLSVWTDGKTTRALVHTDGAVMLFDGRGTRSMLSVTGPRCVAGAFSPSGAPYVLAWSRGAVDVVGPQGALFTEAVALVETDFTDCALVAGEEAVFGAWRTFRSPPAQARIELDVIDVVDAPTSANLRPPRRSRHETAKNSISNVR